MESTQTALVTGATSGIGTEFAAELARQGHDLVLVARREAELHALAEKLMGAHGTHVTVLPCDLTDPAARAQLVAAVASRGIDVDMLVNNAGYGMHGDVVEADAARTSAMVELNCQALVELTQAFLPAMVERGRGSIINVASTAAFQPIPQMAAYAATKAFVLSFSQALFTECRPKGVKVLCICPGPTETAFFDLAGADDVMTNRRTAEQVVHTALVALARGKSYAVDGAFNAVQAEVAKRAPYVVAGPLAQRVVRHTQR